ncbi:MAG: response regulator [Deltaproteobacteria bacterium]|nr:response regulator [Verrucomicrobiota bacterium]MBT6178124.1 response regulator [Deltaproteobacteria bacterium]MBT6432433.1 response regulator [Deltaproteobacteria bacterium]
MKILFVDDEPLILEGLQNLLRRFRKKWAMSFAVGADEALEKLDIETFDIVITDMRMPGLSGAELLKRVRETHPGTARIMLSGYSEEETILQALPVAHQYMSKPCDPIILQRIIENLVSGIEHLNNPAVAQSANRLGAPLTSAQNLSTLQELLEHPEESGDAIQRLVASDIGLSARLLQIVSSSFFGRPQVVSDVGQAIHYLGMPMLKRLAHHPEIFNVTLPTQPDALQQFNDVTATAQHFSQHLAVLLGEGAEGGPGTTAAMLIALGPLAMVQMGEDLNPGSQLEAGLSQFLLQLWGLPEKLTQLSDNLHHQPAGNTLEVEQAIYASRKVWLNRQSREVELDVDYLKSLGLVAEVEEWTTRIKSRSNRDTL